MRTTLVFAAGALFVGGLAAVASAEVAGAKPSAHVHIVPTTADHRMARSVEAIEAARTPRLIAVLREKHAHNAAWFGATVAVSNDGRTLLIGATDESNDRGAAWIYSKVRSRWLPEARLARPTPTRGDLFGSEVALSGDGLTALVSSIGYHHRIGAVWVYRRTGSGWRLGARLTARDEVGQAEFGWAVALSADGATALIGGPVDNPPKGFRGHLGAGAAWVFHRTDGTWAQEGPKLTGVGETDTGVFGAAVALSADGRTALVGAGYAHSGRGTAWTSSDRELGGKKRERRCTRTMQEDSLSSAPSPRFPRTGGRRSSPGQPMTTATVLSGHSLATAHAGYSAEKSSRRRGKSQSISEAAWPSRRTVQRC